MNVRQCIVVFLIYTAFPKPHPLEFIGMNFIAGIIEVVTPQENNFIPLCLSYYLEFMFAVCTK